MGSDLRFLDSLRTRWPLGLLLVVTMIFRRFSFAFFGSLEGKPCSQSQSIQLSYHEIKLSLRQDFVAVSLFRRFQNKWQNSGPTNKVLLDSKTYCIKECTASTMSARCLRSSEVALSSRLIPHLPKTVKSFLVKIFLQVSADKLPE